VFGFSSFPKDGDMYNDEEDWDEGYSMPFEEEDPGPGRSEGWVLGVWIHHFMGIPSVIKHGKLGNPRSKWMF